MEDSRPRRRGRKKPGRPFKEVSKPPVRYFQGAEVASKILGNSMFCRKKQYLTRKSKIFGKTLAKLSLIDEFVVKILYFDKT